MAIEMQVRPLGAWPGGKRTPHGERRIAPFRHKHWKPNERTGNLEPHGTRQVPVAQTLNELRFELEQIGCKRAVIEAGFRDWDIGKDGWPLARARTPEDPGVVLRILSSRVGELTYPCDTFTTWEGNIRAIMLALEALRKVDRYGVTKRGEQYAGWKALPSRGTDTLTAEAAAALLVALAQPAIDSRDAARISATVLESADTARSIFETARKRTHPDVGGSTDAFQQVGQAWGALQAHFGNGGSQ